MNSKLMELRENIVAGLMLLNELGYEVDFTQQLGFVMKVQLAMPLLKRYAINEANPPVDELERIKLIVPFEEMLLEYAELVKDEARPDPKVLVLVIEVDPDVSDLPDPFSKD